MEKNEAGKDRDVPRWQEWEREQALDRVRSLSHPEKTQFEQSPDTVKGAGHAVSF